MHVQFAFSCKLRKIDYGYVGTDNLVTPALTVVVPRGCTLFPSTSRLSREYHRPPAACARLLVFCQSVRITQTFFSRSITNIFHLSPYKFYLLCSIRKGWILSALPLGRWHLYDRWLWSILYFRSQFLGRVLDWLPNCCGCRDRHGHAASDLSCAEALSETRHVCHCEYHVV